MREKEGVDCGRMVARREACRRAANSLTLVIGRLLGAWVWAVRGVPRAFVTEIAPKLRGSLVALVDVAINWASFGWLRLFVDATQLGRSFNVAPWRVSGFVRLAFAVFMLFVVQYQVPRW